MQLDLSEFPLIWMRPHEGDHEDTEGHLEETRAALTSLLESNQPFVIMADRLPSMADITHQSVAERREATLLFKQYRAEFSALCRAMIIVGDFVALPGPVKKVAETMGTMIGMPLIFARSIDSAREQAREKLA